MRSKHHEDMIFDGYPGHVMSGTSLIITTALIVVLHCQSAAGNCPYKQTVYEWVSLWQKYIPRDYRLEIPLSCGDKILCEDIKRALLISHCWNFNCIVKHGASNSCEATYRKTKELIRCFGDNPNCSNIKEVQIQNQAQRKYMLIDDMLSEKINGCLEKKDVSKTGDDDSEFTSPPAKTTTPTTSIIPTTPSPMKTNRTDSRPSPSTAFSETSEKTVVRLLVISLCLNVALVLLLLKQKRRQTQLLNRNGHMPTNVSTQEDSSL